MNKEMQQQFVSIAVEAFNGGLKQGAEIERERIIELWREFMGDADADRLVELIKGENK